MKSGSTAGGARHSARRACNENARIHGDAREATLLLTADKFLQQFAAQPALVPKFVAHEMSASFVAILQADRTPDAGQRSAIIYSVLGSCRRHGINPDEYLRDLFERLPKAKTSEVKALTPAAWAKIKRAAARQSV